MNINKFYIKKSESVINQTLILVDYINKKVKTDNFQKLIRIISNTFGIPLEKVEFEIKKNLVENHNFQIGKFSKKFNLVFMPISVIKYLTSFFYILIFSSRYKNLQDFEIEAKRIFKNVMLAEDGKEFDIS